MNFKQKIALATAASEILKRKKKRKQTVWTKPWLGDHQRLNHGFTHCLEPTFRSKSSDEFRSYVRMDVQTYDELLAQLNPYLTRKNTNYRLSITPRERLSMTLYYLAEDLSFKRLSYEYIVGASTAAKIVGETIKAINKTLVPQFLQFPNTENEWELIGNRFYELWNFPFCIGAMDGKHIHMFPPRNSGTLYFNYKEGFSIVLLGLVDADYKFIAIDVGANGKCSDSGVWAEPKIREAINDTKTGIPPPSVLPRSEKVAPYVIVADSGFGLEKNVMKPYLESDMSQENRIFNYRLSRARRVSENAFGILANRWRILLNRMLMSPERATELVTACCALHNMLRTKVSSQNLYMPFDFPDREDPETGAIIPGRLIV